MKPSWLIEKDVFEDNHDKLIEEVRRQGMIAKIVDYIPFKYDDLKELYKMCDKFYNSDDCVIFYGSLNLGRKIRKTPWVPGVYLNERAFECTSYYPVLGNKLIHHNYTMLPYGDLFRMKDKLYENFHSNKIFLRPNSGNKQFTGMVIDIDDYEECVRLAGFYDVEPDLLVVASPVYPLDKEWRFVVVNQEVISGSLYRDWSKPEKLAPGCVTRDYILMNSHSKSEECDDGMAWMAARQAALLYNPDVCYTIDIAKIDSPMGVSYGVLEVGCFSCAGMYGNNIEDVVKAVSAAALKEWEEYRKE